MANKHSLTDTTAIPNYYAMHTAGPRELGLDLARGGFCPAEYDGGRKSDCGDSGTEECAVCVWRWVVSATASRR